MTLSFPIRQACPPGACVCERETLLANPQADTRVLRLTRAEEKVLEQRLETLASLAELRRMLARIEEQLGIVVRMSASLRGVRTVSGISIKLEAMPGLCKRTHTAIPRAIRRALKRQPELVYAWLDAEGLGGNLGLFDFDLDVTDDEVDDA